MKKLATAIVLLAIPVAIILWFLSAPAKLDAAETARIDAGNAIAGEKMFWAGGCGSCHADKEAKGEDKKKLGGGHRLTTPVGVFVTPNISPDPDTGIGKWSGEDFANAMLNGVSPEASHYFPSFPYTSYTRMEIGDIADLWAFMKTLPVVSRANEPHEISFPFNVRRGIGLWKLLHMSNDPVAKIDSNDSVLAHGQYLVEGPGHCGECHTSRTMFGLGGTDKSSWLSGGPNPEGKGTIPNITPAGKEIKGWSVAEIAEYLKSGFTPDFDSVGGSMVSVQDNMSRLSDEDHAAIAAYLKAIPSVDSN